VEKEVLLVKTLLTARDILFEETQKLSKAIDRSIDFTDFISELDDTKLFGPLLGADVASTNSDAQRLELALSQNRPEVSVYDFLNNYGIDIVVPEGAFVLLFVRALF